MLGCCCAVISLLRFRLSFGKDHSLGYRCLAADREAFASEACGFVYYDYTEKCECRLTITKHGLN